jgi:hypothetical protein
VHLRVGDSRTNLRAPDLVDCDICSWGTPMENGLNRYVAPITAAAPAPAGRVDAPIFSLRRGSIPVPVMKTNVVLVRRRIEFGYKPRRPRSRSTQEADRVRANLAQLIGVDLPSSPPDPAIREPRFSREARQRLAGARRSGLHGCSSCARRRNCDFVVPAERIVTDC